MTNKQVEKMFLSMEEELRLEMFRYTNDSTVVDDAYQDAYLKIHKYKKKRKKWYGNEASIKAMLRFMCKNIVIDKYRSNQRGKVIYTDKTYSVEDSDTPQEWLETIEQEPQQEEFNKRLQEAFKLMNKDTYMTYKLRMKGLKFKEIAYLTDCGINTALGRMRYAVLKIEEVFNSN